MKKIKKIMLSFLVILIISIAACQQAVKKSAGEKNDAAIENKNAGGYAEAEQVGKELSNVDSVEKDLSADEFGDLDAGLSDAQNI